MIGPAPRPSRPREVRRCYLWVGLVSLLGACGQEPPPATEIVLAVDTDWPALELAEVELRGFGNDEKVRIALGDEPAPRTLGLVHAGGPLGPFGLTVFGYREEASEPVLVEPRSEIFFVENETRLLRVELLMACENVCGDEQACVIDATNATRCETSADAVKLEPWAGGARLMPLQRITMSPPPNVDDGGRPPVTGRDPGPKTSIDGVEDPGARAPAPAAQDASPVSEDAGKPFERDPTVVPTVCRPECKLPEGMMHSSVACIDGACQMACQEGYADCDGDLDNGCEADLEDHCGPCASMPGLRKTLTVDGTAVGEDMSDFVALIALDDSDLESASDSGHDLCFTDSEGNALAFEIDAWDQEARHLRAWVKLPALAAGQTTSLHMYFADGRDTDRSDAEAVWASDYVGVWHLSDTRDSVAALVGEASMASPGPGYIGRGYDFDGDEGYIEFDQAELDNAFRGGATVEAWIRPRDWGENSFGRIVTKARTTESHDGWGLYVCNNPITRSTLCFAYDELGPLPDEWAAPHESLSLDTWQHVAVTYEPLVDLVPRMYVNGYEVPVITIDNARMGENDDADHPLRIGNHSHESVRTFDGTIDELRISRHVRDPAWITTQFANQAENGTFITVDAAQPVPQTN